MFFKSSPAKLQDCREHGAASDAELFLVEGDSASLAVARLRDPRHQAVLPMQGKPMNATRASPQKVIENALFGALIEALGAGIGDDFALDKVRYRQLVLLMDPDADGIHCGALMLMFFHRYMPALLAQERVLMVRPPVGEVLDRETGVIHFAYTEAEFMQLCEQHNAGFGDKVLTLKYRGLAGMHAQQLEQSCIHPATRVASVMRLRDAEMAQAVFGGV
ncbi:MAG: toprim domain-containing protein [Thiobacillus sp.]